MTQSLNELKNIDLKKFHSQANEEQFPALAEAILKLRPVLNKFRQHHFIGVPAFRRLRISDVIFPTRINGCNTIYSNIRLTGRWLEERGFEPESNYYVLALNGLLILCPENFPEHREANAARECELIFGSSGL